MARSSTPRQGPQSESDDLTRSAAIIRGSAAAATPPAPAPSSEGSTSGTSAQDQSNVEADSVRTALIEVPLLRSKAYAGKNLRDLSAKNAQTLRDLTDGFIAENASLANGRIVKTPDDALALMLERIADACVAVEN